MDSATFEKLLLQLTPLIEKKDTHLRRAIPAADRLMVTLRYLATGESKTSLHFSFRMGKSTLTSIIREVCKALVQVLQDAKTIATPHTAKEWVDIAVNFYHKWQFPLCLGAIDGKHVLIRPPTLSGAHFFNYKLNFSIVLLAVVDADYNFLYVDVGTNGRISDGGVFAKSDLKKAIDSNVLNMPNSALLPHTKVKCPFVLVGDDAFPLSMRLMKPYPQRQLSKEKRIFNYRLSRARRIVENAFGILSSRFGIFQKPIAASVEDVKTITLTTCYLHNMLRKETRSYVTQTLVDNENHVETTIRLGDWRDMPYSFHPLVNESTRSTAHALAVRDKFCAYFSGPGQVPWQESMLLR